MNEEEEEEEEDREKEVKGGQKKKIGLKETVIFVTIVLVIAWVPIIVSGPSDENTISAEVLDNPGALFPDIDGYLKRNISGSMIKWLVVLNTTEFLSAYSYSKDGKVVWVLLQKAKSPKSFHLPRLCYIASKWNVDESYEYLVNGRKTEYMLVSKDNGEREVVYWYLHVSNKKQKYLIFYLPETTKEILFVRIEVQKGDNSAQMLKDVSEALMENINKKARG
jgi:hypothetical protein